MNNGGVVTSCSSAVAKISLGGGLLACGLMGENLFQDCPENFINFTSGWVLGSHSACLLGLTSIGWGLYDLCHLTKDSGCQIVNRIDRFVCSNGVGLSGGRTSPDLSPVLPHGISEREFNHVIVSGCRFEIPEFDPAKPIYGKDDDIFEEKEHEDYCSGEVELHTILRCYRSSVSPERAEEICGEVLRTYSLAKAQLHQAQLFHGSTSAALLAFTEYNDCSGSLIPLGLLEAKRKVPFAGEVCFGRKNVNAQNLSTTWIEGLKDALWYSSRLTKWSTTTGNEAVTRLEDLCKKIYRNNPKTMICEKLKIALQSGNFDSFERALELETFIPEFYDMNSLIIDVKRLKEWDKLNAFEKKLIEEPFSVLFGIKSDRKDVYTLVDSSIYSEIGLFGGAMRDEIKVIFVPADKVDFVKNLFLNKGFNKIAVEVLPKKTF